MADAASTPPSSSSSSSYGYAISLGSCVAGIPVKLHYSFFLLLLLEFASSLMNFRIGDDKHPMYILLVVVLYGPILLLTILVSSLTHRRRTRSLMNDSFISSLTLLPPPPPSFSHSGSIPPSNFVDHRTTPPHIAIHAYNRSTDAATRFTSSVTR
jgi:hypothetical protein